MTVHRYCLLGLPRTGSQYIAEMLSTTVGSLDLGEPFTKSKSLPNILIKDNLIKKSTHFNFGNIETQIKYVLNCLKNADIEQPLLMRLFLVELIASYIPDIIEELSKLNFKFLIIRRENIEHHLLSYIIAQHTNIWNTKFSNNQPYPKDTLFNITNLNGAAWLHNQRRVFDTVLTKLNINCEIIRYEHAVTDLEKALGTTINTNISLKKQIPSDPYEMIENVEEVKIFLNNLQKE